MPLLTMARWMLGGQHCARGARRMAIAQLILLCQGQLRGGAVSFWGSRAASSLFSVSSLCGPHSFLFTSTCGKGGPYIRGYSGDSLAISYK